jgi:hypothetical protein
MEPWPNVIIDHNKQFDLKECSVAQGCMSSPKEIVQDHHTQMTDEVLSHIRYPLDENTICWTIRMNILSAFAHSTTS